MAPLVDVFGDGRLQKDVLVEGHGPCPKSGSRVVVHYRGSVAESGEIFDDSWERGEPFDFFLDQGDVIEGWDLAVATMKPGERALFTLSPDLAYGEEGAGDDIPPNAVLEFEMELLSGKREVVDAAPKVEPATAKQLLEKGSDAKELGNKLVKAGDFSAARDAYREALEKISQWPSTELLKPRAQLRLSCLLNLAQCCLKLEDFSETARYASEALEIEPGNCKALYRRGIARLAGGELELAKSDFVEAARSDPKNTEIRAQLEVCKQRMSEHRERSQGMYGGMFGGRGPSQQITSHRPSDCTFVWMMIKIGDYTPREVRFALFADTVPKTVENFQKLCTGVQGKGQCGRPLHYRDTPIHRVVPGSMMVAGDIENGDGSGGESIYGKSFEDEAFVDTHHKRGLLSMWNAGPNTNSSQFFVTFRSLPHFDGKHVVFGEVVEGMYVFDAIEQMELEYPDKPSRSVIITNCGLQA